MKRIQDACDEAGCKVEYYGDEYGFTVRFYRHCGKGWGTDMGAKTTGSKVPNVTLDVTLGVILENPVEASVFELIRENASITIPQMAEKLSINRRTVQRAINSLKEKGIIERKGGKRYGYWDVKN
ncbi:MAG: winged helix-turn-helix domain-containing protein [Lachnospiraceae bacterium]|nr:winged helix-turn-helix domain-containing protein [Lachnospiraceae bacterium]